jgi:hypothetical protein
MQEDKQYATLETAYGGGPVYEPSLPSPYLRGGNSVQEPLGPSEGPNYRGPVTFDQNGGDVNNYNPSNCGPHIYEQQGTHDTYIQGYHEAPGQPYVTVDTTAPYPTGASPGPNCRCGMYFPSGNFMPYTTCGGGRYLISVGSYHVMRWINGMW